MRKLLLSLALASFLVPVAHAEILPHPQGCSYRAFCGCGVSIKVFGRPIRELFLASNWSKFPRTGLAAGMVAWRHGHVLYIEQVINYAKRIVLAYDPNSGGHKTRRHKRQLDGRFSIVNPHATPVATPVRYAHKTKRKRKTYSYRRHRYYDHRRYDRFVGSW